MKESSVSVRRRRGNRRIHTPRPRTRSRWVSDTGSFRIERGRAASLGFTIVGLLVVTFAAGYWMGRRTEEVSRWTENRAPVNDDGAVMHEQPTEEELTFFQTLDQNPKSAKPEALVPQGQVQQPSGLDLPVAEPQQIPAPPTEDDLTVAMDRVRNRISELTRPEDDVLDIRDSLNDGPARPGNFTIQVSAHRSQDEAAGYARKLQRLDLNPVVVQGSSEDGIVWYRVRLGNFNTSDDAQQAKSWLSQRDINGLILKQL